MRLDHMLKKMINEPTWERVSILKSKSIFTLTSRDFSNSTSIMILETTIFVIRNCLLEETLNNPIQESTIFVDLEELTIKAT